MLSRGRTETKEIFTCLRAVTLGMEINEICQLSVTETKTNSMICCPVLSQSFLLRRKYKSSLILSFKTMRQEPSKSVDAFVKKIRTLVEECYFTNPDEHIIDALVFGSNSKRTQTKLLEKDASLTLDTALDIARTEEVMSKRLKGISSDVSTRVDALKYGRASSKAGNSRGPSFVCADVMAWSTIYLNDLYAQLMDQYVVHVVVTKGILKHLKKNPSVSGLW